MDSVIYLDADRTISSANESGDKLLRESDVIIEKNNRLHGVTATFQYSIAQIFMNGDSKRLLLPSTKGLSPLRLKFSLLKETWELRASRVEQNIQPSAVDLTAVYELTQAEALVVNELLTSDAESVIANRLGLSEETVRTHRKRVYAKLDVTNRASMIRLMWQLSSF